MSVVTIMVLTASSAYADSLNLAWDAASDPVSGYSVYVGTTSGSYSQRFDVGNTTGFVYPSATAGQQYCFTVAAYNSVGEGPKAAEVCGYSNRYPTLTNPGNQSSTVGQSSSLQLNGSDPDGQAVSYNATNLPPGLSLMSTTGYISGSGTTAGAYNVIALVTDGVLSQTQSFTWTINAPAPTADVIAPSISILTPTSGSSFSTTGGSIAMSGSGADNVGVQQVSWMNDRGGNGNASGTASWNVGSIPLFGGINNITVTARDAAGNTGTDILTVDYTPPTSSAPVVLSGSVTPARMKQYVNLEWTTAPWSLVSVYRNGTRIKDTTNDGAYVDQLRSNGTYTYKVCAPGSTVCSNTVTVYY